MSRHKKLLTQAQIIPPFLTSCRASGEYFRLWVTHARKMSHLYFFNPPMEYVIGFTRRDRAGPPARSRVFPKLVRAIALGHENQMLADSLFNF